jgi:hypothetical protein
MNKVTQLHPDAEMQIGLGLSEHTFLLSLVLPEGAVENAMRSIVSISGIRSLEQVDDSLWTIPSNFK